MTEWIQGFFIGMAVGTVLITFGIVLGIEWRKSWIEKK